MLASPDHRVQRDLRARPLYHRGGVTNNDDLWDAVPANDVGVRFRLVAANLLGATLVAFVGWVVGVPAGSHGVQASVVGGLVGLGFLAAAAPIELTRATRQARRTFGWVEVRRRPIEEEVADVFRYPLVQAVWIFGWWTAGGALIGTANLVLGNNLAYSLRFGLDIVLGGLTASALSFLMLERFNRPVFALALDTHPAAAAGGLGLQRRLLLTWALGAVVPVIVIVSAPAGISAARRAQLAGPVALVGAIALTVGFVLTVVAARSITDPIDILRASQARVEEGLLDVAVPVDDTGEVGQLQAGFNRMVAGLRERQRIREVFGRHVGVEVARRALSDEAALGGELKDGSALFVDLIGSTGLAQRRPPQEVVALLNEMFSVVVRCAAAEGGWVNKFEGDAALCIFGPPADDSDHAARALRAARAMREALAEMGNRHPDFAAGIGVSSGRVVAGNIGAEDRYEYTIIGDPVNEAARLTEEAKSDPGRLLASGGAVARAGSESAHWQPCGSRVLRGRNEPTEVYAARTQQPSA